MSGASRGDISAAQPAIDPADCLAQKLTRRTASSVNYRNVLRFRESGERTKGRPCEPPPFLLGSLSELTTELVFGLSQPALGSLQVLLGPFDARLATAAQLDANHSGEHHRGQRRRGPAPRHQTADLQRDAHQPRIERHGSACVRPAPGRPAVVRRCARAGRRPAR